MQHPVYLDYNSTTPLDNRVLDQMMPYLTEQFGNASSIQHSFGWQADEAIKKARQQVADLIQASAEEIYFTSGATESVNLAVKGVFESYVSKGQHLICLSTEHKAVLDTHEYLQKKGADVTYLAVDAGGLLDLAEFEKAIRLDTVLVSIMLANNETGVIQPIKAIAEICSQHNVLLFCDASQAAGKIQIAVKDSGIPLLALSAHKIYGPKGVGTLYISRKNPRVTVIPQIHGGGHESGKRSGTLNVPGIAGLGMAADIANREMYDETKRLKLLRDRFENLLQNSVPNLKINGNLEHRMTHVSNLMFPDVSAAELMNKIPFVACASGSACSAADPSPSHVLKAMGLTDSEVKSSLRFSLGRFTTTEEIKVAAQAISVAYHELLKNNLPLHRI